MGLVASCGGEEVAENLRAGDTLRNVFDSFARQSSYCYERGYERKSAEGSLEAF